MWSKSELASEEAQRNLAEVSIYKALFEWQTTIDFAPLYKGAMNLWISSQSKNFPSQVVQEFHRDFPAFNLRDERVSPDAFSGAVSENAKDESHPDVAFIDNYRELHRLIAAKAVWLPWGRDRFRAIGWWVIFKDAKHIDQARAFFRWLSRSPHWHPMRVKRTTLSAEQIQAIQWTSSEASHRMLAGDTAALDLLLDKDAVRFRLAPADKGFELVDVKPILTFGSAETAFVILAAVGSGDEFYGVRYQAFILRNDSGDWRVLYFAENEDLGPGEELFHTFDEKMTSDRKSPPPPKADLVSPPDKARLPRFPTRPTIEWTVVSSTGLSFIVESEFGQPGVEESWSKSALWFVEVPGNHQTFATTAPFGVGMQPHRWRIWTLNPSGGISISDWREIDFTN
jgi:hypothetical protein